MGESIFKKDISIQILQSYNTATLAENLGIEFTEVGNDFIKAKMPVDKRTMQPFGVLHGGASVALAETLASIAGYFVVEDQKYCVGLEINANHLRPAKKEFVIGTCKPIHLGKSTQVWEIKISDSEDKLVCISRCTLAVLENK